MAKVDFHVPVSATITFSLINYAESTYDYGLLSDIDTTLALNYSADTSNVYWSGKNNNSASVQTVTYQMSAGDHFIYVKFFKDQYTDENNDSLQFKVSITLNEPFTPETYYAYTISNVQADHTIVVTAGGQVQTIYIKTGGSWTAQSVQKVYVKTGGAWAEKTDWSQAFSTAQKYLKGN